MDRRQALRTTLTMAAAAATLRGELLARQSPARDRLPGQHALRQSGRRRRELRRQRRAGS